MAEVDILDFMRTSKRTIKQALGSYAGSPEEGGIARWKHVAIHYYRCEDEHSYSETENRLERFSELREILELDPAEVPDFSTINKSFDRFKMWVWRALIRAAAKLLPQSGFAALDSTFFDRWHASAYYRDRAERAVETLKVTTLTDTESLAILDVQCYTQWRHDTKAGPQVVRRNADDLQVVAAHRLSGLAHRVRILHARR